MHDSATLLDLSVLGINAAKAVPYDEVYAVGFRGHGVLDNLRYGMARAIVENDGPQGPAAFLRCRPYVFLLCCTKLAVYGPIGTIRKLGPNTLAALNRLANGCK